MVWFWISNQSIGTFPVSWGMSRAEPNHCSQLGVYERFVLEMWQACICIVNMFVTSLLNHSHSPRYAHSNVLLYYYCCMLNRMSRPTSMLLHRLNQHMHNTLPTMHSRAMSSIHTAQKKVGRYLDVSAEEAVNNILFNTPATKQRATSHILCALVSNEPGVLSKVSGCLASRGFNIDSLVVSATESPDLSRMTIRLRGQHHVMEQARSQLEDLVPVWAVLDYSQNLLIERECLLIKLSTSVQDTPAPAEGVAVFDQPFPHSFAKRQAIRDLTELFQGQVLDVGTEHCVVQLTAKSSRIDAYMSLVQPFGVIESSRSGLMVMSRSAVAGIRVPRNVHEEEEDDEERVDLASLPPS